MSSTLSIWPAPVAEGGRAKKLFGLSPFASARMLFWASRLVFGVSSVLWTVVVTRPGRACYVVYFLATTSASDSARSGAGSSLDTLGARGDLSLVFLDLS